MVGIEIPKRQQRQRPEQIDVRDSIYTTLSKPLKYVKNESIKAYNRLKRPKPRPRSFRPCDINNYIVEGCKQDSNCPLENEDLEDFFDGVQGSSMACTVKCILSRRVKLPPPPRMRAASAQKSLKFFSCCVSQRIQPYELDLLDSRDEVDSGSNWIILTRSNGQITLDEDHADDGTDEVDGRMDDFGNFLRDIADNSNRVSVGLKYARRLFGFEPAKQQIYSRAYFTVWITLIQLIIFLIMIASYGAAPVGVSYNREDKDILMIDTNIRSVSHQELRNLWIGPRQEDLIHLGAKFTPCIKSDPGVLNLLASFKSAERQTGCCVYNDGSGCVQTSRSQCSPFLSSWTNNTVCGQDPRYCRDEISSGTNNWGSDITNWPTCQNSINSTTPTDYHMKCALVGRPCCVGVLGQCVMATREYCDFRRGYFHQEAFLCSQVSCLGEVCGMLPFRVANKPDQFYRFFTSQFIHPGILALIITQLFQWLLMYDLERLVGTFEMFVVYLYCGVCGSVMSAIFMPYYVEAGPSGSQFGVLAILSVEIIRWNVEERPMAQIVIILLGVVVLFAIGLIVPQVDNWAHLGGFAVGIFLAFAFRPFTTYRGKDIIKGVIIPLRLISLAIALFGLTILLIIFYMWDSINCKSCLYFNCIPFSDHYCDGMSINVSAIDVYKQKI